MLSANLLRQEICSIFYLAELNTSHGGLMQMEYGVEDKRIITSVPTLLSNLLQFHEKNPPDTVFHTEVTHICAIYKNLKEFKGVKKDVRQLTETE